MKPWLAAILNLVWGLGYLYLGKRTVFVKLITVGFIGTATLGILEIANGEFGVKIQGELPVWVQVISGVFTLAIYFAFAYDAY